jgi:hypothetical protein
VKEVKKRKRGENERVGDRDEMRERERLKENV